MGQRKRTEGPRSKKSGRVIKELSQGAAPGSSEPEGPVAGASRPPQKSRRVDSATPRRSRQLEDIPPIQNGPANNIGRAVSATINRAKKVATFQADEKTITVDLVDVTTTAPQEQPQSTTADIRIVDYYYDNNDTLRYKAVLESEVDDYINERAAQKCPPSIGEIHTGRLQQNKLSQNASRNKITVKWSPFTLTYPNGARVFVDLPAGREENSVDIAKEYDIQIVEITQSGKEYKAILVREAANERIDADILGVASQEFLQQKEAARKPHVERFATAGAVVMNDSFEKYHSAHFQRKTTDGNELVAQSSAGRDPLTVRPLRPIDRVVLDMDNGVDSSVIVLGADANNPQEKEGILERDYKILQLFNSYTDLLRNKHAVIAAAENAIKPQSASKQKDKALSIIQVRQSILDAFAGLMRPSEPSSLNTGQVMENLLSDAIQTLQGLIDEYRLTSRSLSGAKIPIALEDALQRERQFLDRSVQDTEILSQRVQEMFQKQTDVIAAYVKENNLSQGDALGEGFDAFVKEDNQTNPLTKTARVQALFDWAQAYMKRYPDVLTKSVVAVPSQPRSAEPAAGTAAVAAPVTAIEPQGSTPPVSTTETTDPNQSVVARVVAAETEPARDPELVVLESFKTVFGLPEDFDVVEALQAGPITVMLNQRLSYTDPVSGSVLRPAAFEIHGISYDSKNPAGAKVSMIEKYEGENGGLADDEKKVVRTLAVAEKFGPFRLPPVGESDPGPGSESALVAPESEPEGTGWEHSDSGLDPNEDSEQVLVDEKIIAEFVAAFDLWIESDSAKTPASLWQICARIQGVDSVAVTTKVAKAYLKNGLIIMLPASVRPQGMNYQDRFDFTDPSIAVDNTTVIKKLIHPAILTGDGAQVLEKGLLEIERLNIPSAASRGTKDAAAQGGETSSVTAGLGEGEIIWGGAQPLEGDDLAKRLQEENQNIPQDFEQVIPRAELNWQSQHTFMQTLRVAIYKLRRNLSGRIWTTFGLSDLHADSAVRRAFFQARVSDQYRQQTILSEILNNLCTQPGSPIALVMDADSQAFYRSPAVTKYKFLDNSSYKPTILKTEPTTVASPVEQAVGVTEVNAVSNDLPVQTQPVAAEPSVAASSIEKTTGLEVPASLPESIAKRVPEIIRLCNETFDPTKFFDPVQSINLYKDFATEHGLNTADMPGIGVIISDPTQPNAHKLVIPLNGVRVREITFRINSDDTKAKELFIITSGSMNRNDYLKDLIKPAIINAAGTDVMESGEMRGI